MVRTLLSCLLATLVAIATPAVAGSAGATADAPVALPPMPPPAVMGVGQSEDLFVEVLVNGQANGVLAKLVKDGPHLWIGASDLRNAGLLVTGDDRVDVSATDSFRASYDAPAQRLILDVPAALLPMRRIAAAERERVKTSVDTGALVNYDLYVQTGQHHTTAALQTEQRVFGAFGTLSNTGVLRSGFAGRNGYLRFDTRFHHDFEEAAIELTAGDLITRSLSWTTSVRMGGAQVSRNFAIRPDLVTAPLPRFSGEASVPSGVDLFVNGYRQSSSSVQPGRFVLDNVPVINGAGEARVVTTDALGRQIATTIPFYVAPDLLRPGLTDFSVEAGALRRGYGISNFGYRRAAASASARHGVSEAITLSGHVEGAPGLVSGGGGVAARLGLWGTLNASVAASRRDGRTGTQVTAGYSYESRSFSIGAQHVQRATAFADLGSFDLGRFAGSARSDRVSGSVIVGGAGSVGLGFVASRAGDGTRARLASASASMPLGRRASAFAAVDYDVDRGRFSAQLRVILPFGRSNAVASGGISRDPTGSTRANASFAKPIATSGGLGYSADGAIDSYGNALGQASAQYRARAFEAEAGTSTTPHSTSSWVGVTGSLVFLDGRLFTANRLPDAFALVSTGAAKVPVTYENQQVGVTDRHGHMFVPSVPAFHTSSFAIDPSRLPIGAVTPQVERRAAFREGAGAIVRLSVKVVRSVTFHLVDARGTPLAAGIEAMTDAKVPLVVGWDGVAVLEDASGTVSLIARTPHGPCTARVAIPADAAMLADLGAVRCL
jgi:outer membrane usher protein